MVLMVFVPQEVIQWTLSWSAVQSKGSQMSQLLESNCINAKFWYTYGGVQCDLSINCVGYDGGLKIIYTVQYSKVRVF